MAFTPSVVSRQPKYMVTPAATNTNEPVFTPVENNRPSRIHCRSKYFTYGGYLDSRESRTMEFKAAQGNYITNMLPETVAKYGCAFANGTGGNLYLGVKDNGYITGLRLDRHDESRVIRIVQSTFDRFLPRPPSHSVRFVPLRQHDRYHGSRLRSMPYYKVIEISVEGGHTMEIFETKDHKVYIKRDGSVELQNPLQIKDLIIAKYKQELQERSDEA